MNRRLLIVLLGVSVAIAACGTTSEPGEQTTVSPPEQNTTTAAPSTTSTSVPDDEGPGTTEGSDMPDETAAIEDAIADLSERLDLRPTEISVVESRQVEWPDGSLGCPEEGRLYTQAIVDGAQVLLDAEGRIYDYRVDADGNIRFCSSDEKDGGYDFVPPPGFND